jgi:hypothetical protein
MNYRTTLSLSILLLCTQALHAQSFGSNLRINDDAAGATQASPQIRVDRSGTIYVAWTDFRGGSKGDIYLSRSTDGGTTFSKNIPVYTGGTAPSAMQRGVQFVVDSKGAIHMVWMENKGGYDIFYTRSSDGQTFTTPVPLSQDSSKHNQDFPSIALDSSDNIYVAWVDDREAANGISQNHQIYFTRSTDGGQSFSEPIRASNMPERTGGSCECCNTSIAVSPDRHVYISFRSNINDRRDIFIARSLDGGTTFDTAILAASEEWILPACPMSGSSIALDREETAHVVWQDSRKSSGSRNYIYYTTLRFGDDACAPDMRISDSPKCTFPSLGITPDGAILCVYQDSRVDASDVDYAYSLDGGNSFGGGTRLTDETNSSRQDLAICAIGKDGSRYAVWQDSRRDAGDIYFSKDSSPLSLVRPDAVRLTVPENNAILTDFDSFSWSAPANLASVRNVVYDLTYRSEGTTVTIPNVRITGYPAALAPGDYTWHVTARTIAGSSQPSDTFAFRLGASSSVVVSPEPAPELAQNVPNPVGIGGRTVIGFTLPEAASPSGSFTLTLYDALGRQIARLFNGGDRPGSHQVTFDAAGIPAGIYHYELTGSGRRVVRQMVVR